MIPPILDFDSSETKQSDWDSILSGLRASKFTHDNHLGLFEINNGKTQA